MKRRVKKRELSPEVKVRELDMQRAAIQLKLQGATLPAIAKQLGVDERTVRRLRARALEEYLTDRDELVQIAVAEAFATYDAIRRTWWVRAVGGVVTKADGTEERFEPDAEALRLILRAQRDKNLLVSHGQPVRVEHTGAAGGPIVTAQVDAMDRARLIREDFRRRAIGNPLETTSSDDSGAQKH